MNGAWMGTSERSSERGRPEPPRESVSALEREVMAVLLEPAQQTPERIEELLTRCAAESLRLHADRARVQREQAESESVRILELVAEMRLLRDRVIDPARTG